jgi:hypothetical protein
MEHVLMVWTSKSENGRRNLIYGLDTQTWGFKKDHRDYHSPVSWVIFGYDHSGRGPRTTPEDWEAGTLSLYVCQASGGLYVGRAPHWPDEGMNGEVIYPYRLGLVPVTSVSGVSASAAGPLGATGTHVMRSSGIENRGVRTGIDMKMLLALAGVPVDVSSTVNLSATAGVIEPGLPSVRNQRGAGRSNDPKLTAAVEQHAVEMAIAHLTAKKWTFVEKLGKPFDLVFINPEGREKHIEVKGASGSGAEVIYTPNEVQHFRECPEGTDLIVVRDIAVDRTCDPYATSRGELLHLENYRAPAEDLQAVRWQGRVPGWDGADAG